VVRLSPQGEILQTVMLPVSRPTMIAFGGHDLRTAYVTSARTGLSDAALEAQPHAGAILSFPVDVPGVPEVPFAR
jgi:sugar lactone lactonase YvrE